MRRFAISDIHGSYKEMMLLLGYAKFDPNDDQLVVAGDMMNRGPDSGKVLKELKALEENYDQVHVTVGNHEEMMLWYLAGKHDMWVHFGGKQAADSINEAFQEEGVGSLVRWVQTLPLTMEDERFIYAHAGIQLPYRKSQHDRNILWLQRKMFYAIESKTLLDETNGKPVVHGHTPTTAVSFDGARVAIDLGAQVVQSPKLALVELEESIVYEYDFATKTIQIKKIKRK
ncbi:metallophosphoesterase [Bacillus songklensis]|uniref:Metallophosphoesterase n=1 Tax=Bacillus songklensis TaxID=1069116 RepID=A0ABV8B7N3_9BACI